MREIIRKPMKKSKKPERLKKVVVKVLKEGQICWVHFSAVPEKTYDQFLRATETEPADLNVFLSKWCKQDFEVMLRMYKYDDIYHLKKAIVERFESEYPELYGSMEMPKIKGWVRMWLAQHMREEIVMYNERKKNK